MNTNTPKDEQQTLEPMEGRPVMDLLKPFRSIPMELSVELGRSKLTLRELLGLQYHSVFTLDQIAGSRLNAFINGVPLAKAEPVVVENRVGIKIDEILETDA